MSSTTLKRTAATLGVLAGLLAAAGPAGAMPVHMPILGEDGAVAGTQFCGELIGLEPVMKAPASRTSEVFTSVSNVTQLDGDVSHGVLHMSRAGRPGLRRGVGERASTRNATGLPTS